MAEKRRSLRATLIALLVAGTGIVWIGIAAGTYVDARHHIGRLYDAQLAEYSEVLAAVAGHEAYEIAGQTTRMDHPYSQACTYQVYSLGGDLLLRSHEAPLAPLATAMGFSNVDEGGRRWRVHRRIDAESDLVIVVAHNRDERDALVADFALRLLWPFALGLPLLALALWLAVSRSLRPLERLAAEVRDREPGHLAPVQAAEAPAEIEPLVGALNQLFERVQRSFDNERRFTGDAAHELRTPLAALRTHAEVALTTASDERRRRSLEQVVAGVDRASRLVDQLLTLARLDAAHAAYDAPVALAALVRERVAGMRALALARRLRLDLAIGDEPVVAGEGAMIEVLLRNLIENAIRHAPEGGAVRVSLRIEEAQAVLEVEDSGPGVAYALLERIFDRHFRVAGGQGGAGGLGLSIARRIAELHRGTIEASPSLALGGLRVTARLPTLRKESLSAGGDSVPTQPQLEKPA